ncbi:MAG: ABC transporter permease subunit, partial [Anaerolineae bacterium]|nr:ABC transporter permease subunit [Anaerolineae bacterium]
MADGLRNFTLAVIVATALGYALGWLLVRNGDDIAARVQQGRRAALIGWVASPFVILLLLQGFGGPHSVLPSTAMELWGGLLLTMTLTVVGIGVAFPIGVLLALGRRSELPVVRIFCTLSIEFVRGVPLVTILFAASILVPLVDQSLSNVDNVVRAMIGMTFFSAAYLAEIVRGGLQAVPAGQTEAAKALGMPAWQTTLLIVLPQAL